MALSQRRKRLLVRLRGRRTRAREGAVLVEGVRAVSEALEGGVDVSFVVTSPKLASSEAGARLSHRLGAHDVERVDDAELARWCDTERPQGVALVCAEPTDSLDAVRPEGRYLVLDGVQDPGNAGTLIRAAVAFGLDGVLCLEGTVDPWSPKTVRASAGLIFRTPVIQATGQETEARLRTVGVPLVVADPSGQDVEVYPRHRSFAVAVGNEGHGVRPELLERASGSLAVRMPGPAESLNVGIAGSILLYRLTREGE